MGHSYVRCLTHFVFSTKQRRNDITLALQERLWPYLAGIAQHNRMHALAVGGTENHAHLLLSLPSTLTITKAVQCIKGTSSRWIHDTDPSHTGFAWQEGYGAFSVSHSGVDRTIQYIERQREHHKTQTFEEEFIAFLRRHQIEYDERYVWG